MVILGGGSGKRKKNKGNVTVKAANTNDFAFVTLVMKLKGRVEDMVAGVHVIQITRAQCFDPEPYRR